MTDDRRDSRPPLGIIGFGAFGRLMARHLRAHFRVLAYDPAPQPMAGVTLAGLAEAAAAPIVVLATPVNALEAVIGAVAPHLRPGALVLDVGSVKSVPAALMSRLLPPHVDIIATHPLFGPESARDGIAGLKIALCEIRGGRTARIGAFLRKFLGLKVIVTTPEDHDREAAMAQGLTHLIAKVLVRMEPLPSRMTTRSFDLILQAVNMVRNDAPEVFQAIEGANPYSRPVRKRFFELAAELDAEIDATSPQGPRLIAS